MWRNLAISLIVSAVIIMVLIVTACDDLPGLAVPSGDQENADGQSAAGDQAESGLPNPASEHCVEQGGELEIRNEADGQVGYCLFPDGSECEEWALFNGECAPGSAQESEEQSPGRASTLPDLSGLAWMAEDWFIAVHDAKNPDENELPRVSVLKLPDGLDGILWQPQDVEFPGEKSNDFESIARIPDTTYALLVESTEEQEEKPFSRRMFLSSFSGDGIEISDVLEWPVETVNVEGTAVVKKGEQMLFIYAERAEGLGETEIYFAPFTMEPLSLGEFQSAGTFTSPGPTGKDARPVSSIDVDSAGVVYVASAEDPGDDNGPFRSTVYAIARVEVENGAAVVALYEKPEQIAVLDGLKVESLAIREVLGQDRQLFVGLDDENYGGTMRPLPIPVTVIGMPNPASQHCVEQGGELEIRNEADGQVGYCLFPDGSECEEWAFYNGECTPGGAEEAGGAYQPLDPAQCNNVAEAVQETFTLDVATEQVAFDDYVTGDAGTGCQVTAEGSGYDFGSLEEAAAILGVLLEARGWEVDDQYRADGPTGTATAYRLADGLCLAHISWEPAEDADCPDDQPISACELAPDQQLYTATVDCARLEADAELPRTESAPTKAGYSSPGDAAAAGVTTGVSADWVPLEKALDSLEPQQVWQNFYDLTRVPRPSHHEEQVSDFLAQFGLELGLETIQDDVGNVIIRKPATPGMENHQGVIFQAHMDMVPQKTDDKEHNFLTDPIEAYVAGDWVTADSTTLGADDGIGVATAMAFLQSDSLEAGPIEALFTVNEEDGLSGAWGLEPGVLEGDILINLDWETEGSYCIGSAGGEAGDSQTTYDEVALPAGMVAYEVKVQGLKGGHSGVDINLGRGHATKILVRLLKTAFEEYGLRLAALEGGSARNAIPKEASAVVVVPATQSDQFLDSVQEFEGVVKNELSAVEPDLSIGAAPTDLPDKVLGAVFQRDLLDALNGTPQGVMRMSDAVPGLVETSVNVGIVQARDGELKVTHYLRSSVDTAMDGLDQMIASVWELAGIDVEFSGRYPGWKPDPDGPILELMKEVYEDLYGQEAGVEAVHAGLECSVIGDKYPDLEIISVGPTLLDVHTPDEKLLIDSVPMLTGLLQETLARIPE